MQGAHRWINVAWVSGWGNAIVEIFNFMEILSTCYLYLQNVLDFSNKFLRFDQKFRRDIFYSTQLNIWDICE